jgi:hypothetical protein
MASSFSSNLPHGLRLLLQAAVEAATDARASPPPWEMYGGRCC